MPKPPPFDAHYDEHNEYKKWKKDELKARSYMMASMSDELQRKCEEMKSANEIYLALQELYREISRIRQYELNSNLFGMKLKEGVSPEEHVMKMINILRQLHAMKIEMPDTLKERKGKRQKIVSMVSSSKTKKKKSMKSQKKLGTKPRGKGFKKKDLQNSSALAKDLVMLRMSNGANVAAKAMGTCIGEVDHGNDPKTYEEAILDIDS
ncbi:uncharacterized protein LOC116108915 [Pistacia vera]|uniref:uncharacterized protein LOC116108915 n=1 Tax=Pistacia vera TaxID=55513 RepID=UPI001263952F|nr:uncharacterized protein LOC116108915 [Pistacia vera]